MRVCLIDVAPSHYRQDIFELLSQNFDIDFYFGDLMPSIKRLDTNRLKGFQKILPTRQTLRMYRYIGMQPLLGKDYTHYILDGDFRCISSWVFLFRALFRSNKKTYVWTHGWYGRESFLKRLIKKLFFHLTDGIFVYGDRAKFLMVQNGFSADKIHVVHNSLSYDKQIILRQGLTEEPIYKEHFNNSFKNLIFIGRLTSVKRLDLILQAIKILKDRGENYNLTLIGDGPECTKLQGLTKALGIDERVWFFGPSYEEATNARLIYNADLCVSPGNVGLTAMHTLVFGTPVITHNSFEYQMPEYEAIRDCVTGSFFQYGQADSLATAITHWFDKFAGKRKQVREVCYQEIDQNWNPYYSLNIFKNAFKQ